MDMDQFMAAFLDCKIDLADIPANQSRRSDRVRDASKTQVRNQTQIRSLSPKKSQSLSKGARGVKKVQSGGGHGLSPKKARNPNQATMDPQDVIRLLEMYAGSS